MYELYADRIISCNHFSALPMEMKDKIICSYLSPNEKSVAALVCKEWRKIINDQERLIKISSKKNEYFKKIEERNFDKIFPILVNKITIGLAALILIGTAAFVEYRLWREPLDGISLSDKIISAIFDPLYAIFGVAVAIGSTMAVCGCILLACFTMKEKYDVYSFNQLYREDDCVDLESGSSTTEATPLLGHQRSNIRNSY